MMAILENQAERARVRGVSTADESAGRMLERARFLEEDERTLVELLLRGTLSRRQMADLLKIDPATLTRRVQGLVKRLHDPIVLALIEWSHGLSDEHRQLGIEHFLQGKSAGQ